MLTPEPMRRFYAYATKTSRRDLAEALVDFGEVHVERPEGIPGVAPPEDVDTRTLDLYRSLREVLDRILSLGIVPDRGAEPANPEEAEKIKEEAESLISTLLETEKKIELAKRAKSTIKDRLKRKAILEEKLRGLEEAISAYYEMAARMIAKEPEKLRLGRLLLDIEREISAVSSALRICSDSSTSPADARELLTTAAEHLEIVRTLLRSLSPHIPRREYEEVEGIAERIAEKLAAARREVARALKLEDEIAEMKLVESMWERIEESSKRIAALSPLISGESRLAELREKIGEVEAEETKVLAAARGEVEAAASLVRGLTSRFSAIRRELITIEAVEIGEAERRLSDVMSEAQPIYLEIQKIESELEELSEVASPEFLRRAKEQRESVRKGLARVSGRITSILEELRPKAAAEKLESDFLMEGEHIVVASGWVLERRARDLESALRDRLGGFAAVEFEPPGEGSRPPTLVRLKKIFAPFRLLTHKMYGLPSPREIDPTPIITFLFPLMFGFMYGDLGHGIVLALFGAILRLRSDSETMKDFGGVLFYSGVAASIFGIAYGEMFFVHLPYEPILPPPVEEPIALAGLAVMVGAAELALAFFLEGINRLLSREISAALLGFRGFMTLVMYAGAAYAVYRNGGDVIATLHDPLLLSMGIPLLITAVYPVVESVRRGHGVAEGVMEGFITVLESVLTLLSNSLSYLRLAGFAVSHAAFGVLACEMAFGSHCVASTILSEATAAPIGLLIVIFFNIFAMGMEGMLSFIQATRLTFYEFFTKFFSASGVPFKTPEELLD